MRRRAFTPAAVALAGAVAWASLWPAAAASASPSPITLAVVLPKAGAVTESTTPLHVLAGGRLSTIVRFTVTIDGSPVGADGRLLASGPAAEFSVPGGAEKDVDLRDLPEGVHRLVVHAVSPAGIPDASVDFTVGPGSNRPDGKVSLPFVVGLILIGSLLYFTRRRMADFARSLDPDADAPDDAGAPDHSKELDDLSPDGDGPELNGHRDPPVD